MGKIEQIKKAIENAEKLESKLDEGVLAIGGYIGLKNRHFLNNLGQLATNLFEIGNHRGSSICSTMYKNENLKNIYACDNFSQFNEDGTVKRELLSNLETYSPNPYSFFEQDCFTLTREQMPEPIDLFLVDGNHSLESQRNSFTYFKDFLADEFIAVIDDVEWSEVKQGTMYGIRDAKMEIVFQEQLGKGVENDGTGYWNSVLVVLLKKSK